MLDELFKYLELLERFRSVERTVSIPGSNPLRWENDVEHSYMLAMTAWYLNEKYHLGLDLSKILEYALAHDLVEAYAGDVSPFGKKGHKGKIVTEKHQREQAALARIQKEFPDQKNIARVIKAYEKRNDPESHFVYSLDKLMPVVVIYMDGGRAFHHYLLGLDELVKKKKGNVDQHELIAELWQELVARMQSQPELFPENS